MCLSTLTQKIIECRHFFGGRGNTRRLGEERASTTRMEGKGLTHEEVEADSSTSAPQPESEAAVRRHGRLTVMRPRDRILSGYHPHLVRSAEVDHPHPRIL